MRKSLLFAALIALAGAQINAMPVDPQTALQSARSVLAKSGLKKSLSLDLQLAYELRSAAQLPTVYVFSAGDSEPGFIVAAADDASIPVLGYSTESVFDPNNIPPQMQDLLNAFSVSVENLASGNELNANHPFNKRLKSTAGNGTGGTTQPRVDIAPLCSTLWDQGDPYYRMTPIVSGGRTATGCLATAMAQCMKVHEWPITGIGEHSYTFTSGTGTYTDSFNFGATTFDWANMLDSYQSGYTDAQADAVATLMHACGVASEMKYGTMLQGSSAVAIVGAKNLIAKLGYDKGLESVNRVWYSAEEWDQLMYDELAAGRPIAYGGVNDAIGHEFVCDGYRVSDGLYHINWGWSGNSNGYFALANLHPANQGTGGGGTSGYNKSQNAFIKMRAPGDNPSSDYAYVMAAEDFRAKESEYTRTSSIEIVFSGRLYNASLAPMENVTIAFAAQKGTGTTYVQALSSLGKELKGINLDVNAGYTTRAVTGKFPTGTYNVKPVFKVGDGEWQDFKFDRTKTAGYTTLTVTSSKITAETPVAPDAPVDTRMKVELVDYTPHDPYFYKGQTYTFTYRFTAKYPDSAWFWHSLTDYNYKRKVTPTAKEVTFTGPGEQTHSFTITMPLTLDNDYHNVFLAREDATNGQVIDSNSFLSLEVKDAPEAGLDNVAVDSVGGEVEYFDVYGRRVANPAAGMIVIERNTFTGAARKILR